MSAFVVVNPRSGNGRTRREWRAIERELSKIYPHMSVAFTRMRREATQLVRNALREGHHEIVAVGGDGTINEAVNGFSTSMARSRPMLSSRMSPVVPAAIFARASVLRQVRMPVSRI